MPVADSMKLVFERSDGRFKSNCNILTLAWTPYYIEDKFRRALFDYHQKQLTQLAIPANHEDPVRVGYLARGHNARLQHGLRRASSAWPSLLELRSTTNRLNEFCKRCTYAPRQIFDEDTSSESSLNEKPAGSKLPVNVAKTIDLNYGRLDEFGWLVIGNVAKTVGVTLTSTIEPPIDTYEKRDNDLITFHDDSPEDSSLVHRKLEFDRLRPDQIHKRNNHNLRGHLDEVILVKWNELYQKLATVDSKGNVLIWSRLNDKFTIQTPFYNRTKTVADFEWSNDGKTALICYTDSFILVGSSTGQRQWHSMLNLEDYHITCASWTPNDEKLLLGVSNGNVVVIDLQRSELTELLLGHTNVRTMAWSNSDLNLKNLGNVNLFKQHAKPAVPERSRSSAREPHLNRRNDMAMDAERPASETRDQHRSTRTRQKPRQPNFNYKVRNILAVDFASNTFKLFDGGLSDPKPKSVSVDLESYIMQWSSDGTILAVAGFNIHTSAPSVGCLRCHYSNEIKFYNQKGKLIYRSTLRHTRYPITAFTWAHQDQRIFIATGPHLHSAKVFFGLPSLELLAASCIQRFTKLSNKTDYVSTTHLRQFSEKVTSWQSADCAFDLGGRSFRRQVEDRKNSTPGPDMLSELIQTTREQPSYLTGNNCNVFHFQLPLELQLKVDRLFSHSIKQPFDEQWSMSDVIWHVPKKEKRYFCTLVCYTNESEILSTNHQYNQQNQSFLDRDDEDDQSHSSTDQHKIFVLYVEFQGSLIPILRARRVGFLKPEFVIFDPEVDQNYARLMLRQTKVSDLSQSTTPNHRSFDYKRNQSNLATFCGPSVTDRFGLQNRALYSQCHELHQSPPRDKDNPNYDSKLESDSLRYLSYGRSHHQEPVPFANPAQTIPALKHSRIDPHPDIVPSISRSNKFSDQISRIDSDRLLTYCKNKPISRATNLPESHELVRIRSNVWGTKFKIISVGNRMIRRPAIIGAVAYKTSILHLQPRQIFLTIKDMSNYCCLCSMHHHTNQGILRDLKRDLANILKQKDQSPKKRTRKKEDTVILDVGDGVRIAPKLEQNQSYLFSKRNHNNQPFSRYDNPTSTLKRSTTPTITARHDRNKKNRILVTPQTSTDVHRLKNVKLSNQTMKANHEYPEEQDEVLTFTLDQGDQVRVEMSSVDVGYEKRPDPKLENFLSANKALQSIQSITKKLEEMSKAAYSTDLNCKDKTIKLDNNHETTCRSTSQSPSSPEFKECYLVPSTPVHRPRYGRNIDLKDGRSMSIVDTVRRNQIRSSGSRARSEEREQPVELPLPPPSAPLSRRISSTAKRLIDGSLRSLYGSSLFSSTDIDSEEGEILITRKSRKPFRREKRISAQSQPVTPLKRVTNRLRSFGDMNSNVIGSQLTQKFLPSDATRQAWSRIDFKSMTLREQVERSLHCTSPCRPSSSTAGQRYCSSEQFINEIYSVSSSSSESIPEVAKTPLKLDPKRNKKDPTGRVSSTKAKVQNERILACSKSTSTRKSKDSRQHGKPDRRAICDNKNCHCGREFSLSNRPPVWNDYNQVYQLDFGGRVTQESAKNLQIDHEGSLALQFGRLNRCTYTLDYMYPFNAIQAMSVALASLTQRLK